MRIFYLSAHISPLIFLLPFVSACIGHEKLNSSKENVNTQTQNPSFIPSSQSDEQIAEYIRNIFQDKYGNLWFGTNGYGVAHYDGDSVSYFSTAQGFNGYQITGITEDNEKSIWFATDQGVVKYDYSSNNKGEKHFTNYSDQKFFGGQRFWSIFADSEGNI